MIRIFCSHELEFKDSYGFTHYWCALILALELAYKTSIHSSTVKAPEMLEKGWNSRLPYDTHKENLVYIHPTEIIFKIILDKERNDAKRFMKYSFEYSKKIHKPPDFKVGDLVLVSTISFNNSKGQKKFKDSFAGPFMIRELNGPNAVQL
ncbi:hypothetical protein O181_002549 [Austropuccinia psidii MF-1]|uniref:Uncharacterized protein n=1 Tax=Austropuccinia psidii MF-1 TaxID=1389203 RepID=A0A9Q3GCY8_9BASI|nr:hypothetical protein [Austropuccinia psidii MF-1]